MDNYSLKLLKDLDDIDIIIEKINEEIINIIQTENDNDSILSDLKTQIILWENMKTMLFDFYMNC